MPLTMNLRKKVPPSILIDNFFEQNNNFAIQRIGLEHVLKERLREHKQRNVYNEEIVIRYKGPRAEPPPPLLDLIDPYPIKFSPFDYLCLPQRKLATERREYEMSMDDISTSITIPRSMEYA